MIVHVCVSVKIKPSESAYIKNLLLPLKSRSQNQINIDDGCSVAGASYVNYLGFHLDSGLKLQKQVEIFCNKTSKKIGILRFSKTI